LQSNNTAAQFRAEAVGERVVFAADPARTFRVTQVSADHKTLTFDPADGDVLAAAGTQTAAYSGRLDFDLVDVGAAALARVDTALAIGGVVDDRTKARVDSANNGVLLLRGDVPQFTLITTPNDGGNVVRGGPLKVDVKATSAAGIEKLRILYSALSEPYTESFPDMITPRPRVVNLATPATASVGSTVTMFVEATDRAGLVIAPILARPAASAFSSTGSPKPNPMVERRLISLIWRRPTSVRHTGAVTPPTPIVRRLPSRVRERCLRRCSSSADRTPAANRESLCGSSACRSRCCSLPARMSPTFC